MLSILAVPLRAQSARKDEARDAVPPVRDAACTLEALYAEHLDRVYAYLRARTATPEDATDLTQQVFLRAFEALPRFRGKDDQLAAWLFRIVRSTSINHWRRQRPTVTWDIVPEALHPRAQQAPDDALLRDEALLQLRTLLRGLAKDVQELLALRFIAQLTVAQIAVVVGKSDAAVSKQLSRTIQRLQEQYHAHD